MMEYIEQKAGVLGGKAVIKNTRIGVDLILEKIGAGETIDDLLQAYPHIKRGGNSRMYFLRRGIGKK